MWVKYCVVYCQTWWLSLCLLGLLKMFDIPAGARHIVIEENETSPHVIGEFVPVHLSVGINAFLQRHKPRTCILLRPITAFPSCFVCIPQHLPAWLKQFVLIVMFCISFFSLTWIPELMPDVLSEKIWSVQRVLFYNSKTVCTWVDVVCQNSILLVLFVYFVVYRLYSMVYNSGVN